MDNVYASRLGEACRKAVKQPAGDYIDTGWALIKELHAKGFDVVPREPLRMFETRKTLNEMCGLKTDRAAAESASRNSDADALAAGEGQDIFEAINNGGSVNSNIRLVSSQDEAEFKRKEAKEALANRSAVVFSAMCRVAAGAGDAHLTTTALAEWFVALENAESEGALTPESVRQAVTDGLRSWDDEPDCSKNTDDHRCEMNEIVKGALRLVASEITGTRVQSSHAETKIYDGIRKINEKVKRNRLRY